MRERWRDLVRDDVPLESLSQHHSGGSTGIPLTFYRDRNFWVANFDGSGEKQITTDGSLDKRTKNGSGSWVYGEELGQTTAVWWSPDSKLVGYYRFDESQVKDYYLQMNQTAVQDTLDVEAYPKSGQPNPVAEVFVYDDAGHAFNRDVDPHVYSEDAARLAWQRTRDFLQAQLR